MGKSIKLVQIGTDSVLWSASEVASRITASTLNEIGGVKLIKPSEVNSQRDGYTLFCMADCGIPRDLMCSFIDISEGSKWGVATASFKVAPRYVCQRIIDESMCNGDMVGFSHQFIRWCIDGLYEEFMCDVCFVHDDIIQKIGFDPRFDKPADCMTNFVERAEIHGENVARGIRPPAIKAYWGGMGEPPAEESIAIPRSDGVTVYEGEFPCKI